MHLGEISFCGHIGFNIKSDEIKQTILKDLQEKYNVKIINRHFDCYNDDKRCMILNKPHLISLRSNGNPYYLYLTKIQGINQCIFIDKKVQNGYMYPRMVIVKLFFDNVLFENTLFDGEMVKTTKDHWIFVLNDVLVLSGESCFNVSLVKRVSQCHKIIRDNFVAFFQDVCLFQVKRYFHYENLASMIGEFQDSLPYTNRGIYFTPLYAKFRIILYNFNDSLITKKTKVDKKNVFEIHVKNDDVVIAPEPHSKPQTQTQNQTKNIKYLQKTPTTDIYKVFDNNSVELGIAFVNSIVTSKMLKDCFMNTTPIDKLKFECEYNDVFKKWKPLSPIM